MMIHLRETQIFERQMLQPFDRLCWLELAGLHRLQKFQKFLRVHFLRQLCSSGLPAAGRAYPAALSKLITRAIASRRLTCHKSAARLNLSAATTCTKTGKKSSLWV